MGKQYNDHSRHARAKCNCSLPTTLIHNTSLEAWDTSGRPGLISRAVNMMWMERKCGALPDSYWPQSYLTVWAIRPGQCLWPLSTPLPPCPRTRRRPLLESGYLTPNLLLRLKNFTKSLSEVRSLCSSPFLTFRFSRNSLKSHCVRHQARSSKRLTLTQIFFTEFDYNRDRFTFSSQNEIVSVKITG